MYEPDKHEKMRSGPPPTNPIENDNPVELSFSIELRPINDDGSLYAYPVDTPE